MSGPPYHARTHLPGGTDPLPLASNISCYGEGFLRSQTTAGTLPIEFDIVAWNDDSFGYTEVSGGRATYLTISREGWWHGKFLVYWDTDWGSTDQPYIVPSVFLGGTTIDELALNAVIYWSNTANIIHGQQLSADDVLHHALAADVLFNFTADDFGETPLPIGVYIGSSVGATKQFGGAVTLTWLGEALTEQAIA